MPRTLIRNGPVISPTGVSDQDVLIDGETIAAVGASGMFGIHPKKGITAPGADGDVLVRDPTTPTRIGINDNAGRS